VRRHPFGLRVGEAFVRKIIAFACIVTAPALCVWLAPWRSLATQSQGTAPAIVAAGGLFTVAIAVLIRD
jgi:hypothetical protein